MMLSLFDTPEYVQRAVEVGALGFVLKDTMADDLLIAIRTLSTGRQYFSQKIAGIAERFKNQKGDDSWAG